MFDLFALDLVSRLLPQRITPELCSMLRKWRSPACARSKAAETHCCSAGTSSQAETRPSAGESDMFSRCSQQAHCCIHQTTGMSLRQSELKSTKRNLPGCWQRERDRHCLRIELNSGETFLFPYQQLLGGRHVRAGNQETLQISFSTHLITLSGRNLVEVVVALEDLAISWIKPLANRYRELVELDEACVTNIEVKPTDDDHAIV